MGGVLMPHHPNMKYLIAGHIPGVEMEWGFLTTGHKKWHHSYNFPIWGISLNLYDLKSPSLGYAAATRVFYDLPLNPEKTIGLKMEIGAGFLQKPFHLETNIHNSAIGSHLNAALALSIYGRVKIAEKWTLKPGLGIHHFSNGAFTLPNSGINLAMVKIAASYYPTGFESPKREKYFFEKQKHQWLIGTSFGLKQIAPIGSKRHEVINLFGILQQRKSEKSTFGAEIGINYNSSLSHRKNEYAQNQILFNSRLYLAGIYQLNFDPLAVRFQAGTYLFPKFTADGWVYFRYHLVYKTKQWQYFAGLKSHFAKADNLEVGIAYKWKL